MAKRLPVPAFGTLASTQDIPIKQAATPAPPCTLDIVSGFRTSWVHGKFNTARLAVQAAGAVLHGAPLALTLPLK